MADTQRSQNVRSRAFTLVELLMVIGIIGVLVVLLLPSVQAAREASRRATCANNLKQVGLALINVENTHGALPTGAKSQIVNQPTFGMSWWVQIIPYLEQSTVYARLDQTGPHNGWPLLHVANAQVVNGFVVPAMLCPSSSLPPLRGIGGIEAMMPSYVGISGSSRDGGFPEKRVATCCLPENRGEISAGGILISNRGIRSEEILDGLSNSLAVGECSEVATDSMGFSYRVDGGFPNGWTTGTTAIGTAPDYNPLSAPPSWNVTTIRYPPNMRDYDQPGIDDNRGANNPLISAHPAGVHGLFMDGSVRFLTNETDVWSLKLLATRDDGGPPNLSQ